MTNVRQDAISELPTRPEHAIAYALIYIGDCIHDHVAAVDDVARALDKLAIETGGIGISIDRQVDR